MSMNPNQPTLSDPEVNPYAPPEARIGEEMTPGVPDDLAEADAIRRAYLGHEAAVKSIGSLHYLGSIFLVLALGVFVSNVIIHYRQIRGGMEPEQIALVFISSVFITAVSLVLAIGLTGLKPWRGGPRSL